jgi:3D (Asp-Asp-Asp) domain-containing protein
MFYNNLILFVSILLFFACENTPPPKTLKVTATAFNSLNWQTKAGDPTITAWGDTLKPGLKVIAVSRDLLDSGLAHNTVVYIQELQDSFIVKDKMNRRWKKKIDIYMGTDVKQAREFGKQTVTLKWFPAKQPAPSE